VQTLLLFISAEAAQEIEKRRKSYCPLVFQSLPSIQYFNIVLVLTSSGRRLDPLYANKEKVKKWYLNVK
jgi:hypothetical protein